jgi:ABC-2 type transport system permease protein
METTSSLREVNARGWRMGFANLFHEATGSFWHTKKWLIQTALWFLILNGMFLGIWSIPSKTISEAMASFVNITSLNAAMMHPFGYYFMQYFLICSLGLPVAAIIAGQDAIISERQSGTGAWVLSKPVSRVAFILSKLAASTISLLVTGILVQGVGIFAQLSGKIGSAWPIAEFAGAMGLIFLNLMFYLTLTFMLGALFTNRGVVLGISLAAALAGTLMLYLVPIIKEITPWGFFYSALDDMPPGLALALGQPAGSVIPIIGTGLMCVIFIVVTILRFQREEF